jgi:hypothetical protein
VALAYNAVGPDRSPGGGSGLLVARAACAGIAADAIPEVEVVDKEILSLQLNIGTKVYYFDLKSNPSGLYVKIVEKRGERRSNIIVPVDKLADFASMLAEMTQRIAELPPEDAQPPSADPAGPRDGEPGPEDP